MSTQSGPFPGKPSSQSLTKSDQGSNAATKPSGQPLTKADHETVAATKPCINWCKAARAKNLTLLEQIRVLKGEIALRDSLFGEDGLANASFEAQEDHLRSTFGFYQDFTTQQREIFRLLYRRKGKILRQSAIADYLYQLNPDTETNTSNVISVQISKMRAKMKGYRWKIETVHGEGYLLREYQQLVPVVKRPSYQNKATPTQTEEIILEALRQGPRTTSRLYNLIQANPIGGRDRGPSNNIKVHICNLKKRGYNIINRQTSRRDEAIYELIENPPVKSENTCKAAPP